LSEKVHGLVWDAVDTPEVRAPFSASVSDVDLATGLVCSRRHVLEVLWALEDGEFAGNCDKTFVTGEMASAKRRVRVFWIIISQ